MIFFLLVLSCVQGITLFLHAYDRNEGILGASNFLRILQLLTIALIFAACAKKSTESAVQLMWIYAALCNGMFYVCVVSTILIKSPGSYQVAFLFSLYVAVMHSLTLVIDKNPFIFFIYQSALSVAMVVVHYTTLSSYCFRKIGFLLVESAFSPFVFVFLSNLIKLYSVRHSRLMNKASADLLIHTEALARCSGHDANE